MIETIARDIQANPPKNGKFYLIAIDGRGGSGKTTLSEQLTSLLLGFTLIHGDGYFEPKPGELVWGAFNEKRFLEDVVTPLQTGNSFTYRPYDWHAVPAITEQPMTIDKGLVLERCFSMAFPLDWDCTIWIETPAEICLERGLSRETLPRERTLPVWRDIWQPKEDEYIGRTAPAEHASFVIDGTLPFN